MAGAGLHCVPIAVKDIYLTMDIPTKGRDHRAGFERADARRHGGSRGCARRAPFLIGKKRIARISPGVCILHRRAIRATFIAFSGGSSGGSGARPSPQEALRGGLCIRLRYRRVDPYSRQPLRLSRGYSRLSV